MDSKSLSKHKKLLLEFIEMYKSMPCLWDRQHWGYAIRRQRLEAYKTLLQKYRDIDADASLTTVKHRVDIIRNGFIRELKKVRLSKEMSSEPSQQYIPRLFYYDHCTFLENQYLPTKDSQTSKRRSYDNDEENQFTNEYADSQSETVYLEETSNSSIYQDNTPSRKRLKVELIAEPEKLECSSKNSSEDLECIGKAIALQMRDLDPCQSAIAHKLISDTIFYAKLGKLTLDSHVEVNFREDRDYQ